MEFGKVETLKYARVRKVNPPTKAYSAAGWDFYVPEDLKITDFTKNSGVYFNQFVKSMVYGLSPIFHLKSARDGKELAVRFGKAGDKIQYYNCTSGKFIIEEWNQWIEDDQTFVQSIQLGFGQKILIPSGVHVNLPEGICLIAQNKSGVASKRGLLRAASVVDEDYQGEVHINLINCCQGTAVIKAGDKIIQFVPEYVPRVSQTVQLPLGQLYSGVQSARGASGFGSTDNVKESLNGSVAEEGKRRRGKRNE